MPACAEIIRSGDPIDIQLTGTDPKELLALSDQIKTRLGTYPSLFDINDSLDSGRNEIQLRLKPEALAVKIAGHHIAEASNMSIEAAHEWFGGLMKKLDKQRGEIGGRILK